MKDAARLDAAMNRAFAKAVADHRRANVPMVIEGANGGVTLQDPHTVETEQEAKARRRPRSA
jgi:hypothetical protein